MNEQKLEVLPGKNVAELAKDAKKQYMREYGKKYRKKNREILREKQRKWQRENPDKVRANQERYWAKKVQESLRKQG